MIQTYSQLVHTVSKFNKIIEGKPAHIQKIYSSAYTIGLSIRLPGQNLALIIGRGKRVEGIGWLEKNIPSILRTQDKFLSYLRASLTNSILERIEVDTDDRIIRIDYLRWGQRNHFFIFYNKKALNFVNYFYSEKKREFFYLKSWENKPVVWNASIDFSIFNEVGRKNLPDKEKEGKEFDAGKVLKRELVEVEDRTLSKKEKNKTLRKVKNIKFDLEKIKAHKELFAFLEETSDLGELPKKWKFKNIKISFDYPDHYKRRDQIFKKIKALKAAEALVEARLIDAEKKLSGQAEIKDKNPITPIAPAWNKVKERIKAPKIEQKANYKVLDFPNFKVGIGLSANGNDALRSEFASKNDYWFHLDGATSPHVIVKGDNLELNEDLFNIVASVILDHSEYNFSQASIIFTKVKDIKGVKGTPGKVIFKKEKRYYAKKIDWTDLCLNFS